MPEKDPNIWMWIAGGAVALWQSALTVIFAGQSKRLSLTEKRLQDDMLPRKEHDGLCGMTNKRMSDLSAAIIALNVRIDDLPEKIASVIRK